VVAGLSGMRRPDYNESRMDEGKGACAQSLRENKRYQEAIDKLEEIVRQAEEINQIKKRIQWGELQ